MKKARSLILSVVFLLSLLGACQTPAPAPSPTPSHAPTPISTPLPHPYQVPLELKIAFSQSSYLPGEEVVMQLYLENVSNEALEIDGFPPMLEIRRPRSGTRIWRSLTDGQKRVLGPGESLTHDVIWDRRQPNGNFVDPGYYYVDVKDVRATQAGRAIVISGSAYARVLIQHPQGAIDRTLEIEQTQTVSGMVITLQRLDLSPTGAMVYGFARPSDWIPTTPVSPPAVTTPVPTPPLNMYPVPAEYSLDGGPMQDTGSAGFTWLQEGIGLIWDLIDPVPNGTEELTFVITRFGEWPGPWEFRIPLR